MTKEQQDLSWQCLPKEERHKIISVYACKNGSNSLYNEGYRDALKQLYGHHNLISDEEPSELLFVERKKVIDKCNEVIKDYVESGDKWYSGYLYALNEFFDDKESIRKIDAADSLIAMAKDEMDINDKEQFVQCEPKFKVGDKVYCKNIGMVLIVRRIITKYQKYELYDEHGYGCGFWEWDSPNLEPYTEPKTKESECIHPDSDNCKWKNICDHTQYYFDPIKSETKDNPQQNSWDDDFKRFNECCNKIRKTLESLCNSFDKMKDCIDRL